MRQGELLALKWRDVDLDRGVLWVVGSLERVPAEGLRIKEPKTKKSRREIILTRQGVEALRRHRAAQDEVRGLTAAAGDIWDDQDLVFAESVGHTGSGPRKLGHPLDAGNMFRRHFRPFLDQAGLPKIRFHDLRGTTATLLAHSNVNPKEISDFLGHAAISTTLTSYTGPASAAHAAAVHTLEGLLDPSSPKP
jgi:integrase